ncbi:MAG: hypothetical protein AB7Q17_16390 [Phycisphaerae bacterium]
MRMRASSRCTRFAIGSAALLCGAASASATLAPGRYVLRNHPDGAERPPLYGLRLDELYNATSGHDVFTFDFENTASAVFLDYDGSTVRIFGRSFGGRDVGSAYANDSYRGLYDIDFTYAVGVGLATGDDDVWVDGPNHANTGSIRGPNGALIGLWDERGGNPYSFRLGDENNDLGHRGFAGTSGWGWLNHGSADRHVYSSDFIFTVGAQVIPEPGAALLGVLGLGAAAALRRR